MKKTLITIIATFCLLNMFADDVTPGIIVSKTDGSNTSIVFTELRSIKFNEGSMIFNMKDKSKQTFSIDEIRIITFEDVTSAINVLTNGKSTNSNICITDIFGHTVYNSKAADATHLKMPAGLYVITANGKSYKVMIK